MKYVAHAKDRKNNFSNARMRFVCPILVTKKKKMLKLRAP
jgi:hypothetical protein